jgi:hypothetical protein
MKGHSLVPPVGHSDVGSASANGHSSHSVSTARTTWNPAPQWEDPADATDATTTTMLGHWAGNASTQFW